MPLLLNIELIHAYAYIVLFYPYACKAIAFIEYMHFFLILKKKFKYFSLKFLEE